MLFFILKAILGMLLFYVTMASSHMNKNWSWKIWIEENLQIFLWNTVFVVLASICLFLEPESIKAISSFLGMQGQNFSDYFIHGVIFGGALSFGIRSGIIKKFIRKYM